MSSTVQEQAMDSAPGHSADYARHFEAYRSILNTCVRHSLEMFKLSRDGVIVDLGCGFGDDVRRLQEQGHRQVIGVEADRYCVQKRGDLDIRRGTMSDTGLPSGLADAVVVNNVFHHVQEYDTALSEIARILKPEGTLSFIEPRNSVWRRGLDALTFSTPLPKLGGPLGMRHRVMSEEVRTGLYPQWLRSHAEFFALLERKFQMTWLRRDLFFFMGHARRGGTDAR